VPGTCVEPEEEAVIKGGESLPPRSGPAARVLRYPLLLGGYPPLKPPPVPPTMR
jgi:hypothetical protein